MSPLNAEFKVPANIPQLCYAVIVNEMATLNELQTVYGIEDLVDLLEIIAIKNLNQRIAEKASEHANG